MKTKSLSALVALAAATSAMAAPPVLLLEERFNGEGDVTFQNGAELGKGLSDQVDDSCYYADTAAYEGNVRGPIALFPTPNELKNGQEMTVLLWYKSNQPGKGLGALLLAYGWNVSLGENGVNVWLYETREINSRFSAKTGGPWDAADWTFLAMTWSNQDRKAFFLRGSKEEQATVVAEASVKDFPQGISSPGDSRASAGNNLVFGKSPFGGSIDNLRVYDRVLDEKEIESIRQADLKNIEPKFAP